MIRVRRRHLVIRRIALTTAAVAAALLLAEAIPFTSPVVAGITALISVRPSIYSSVTDAGRLLIGTVIGAGIAIGMWAWLGYRFWIVIASILLTLIASALLRLGDHGALNMTITTLLVLGPGSSIDEGLGRMASTVLGVAIALPISFAMLPTTPVQRAHADLARIATRARNLLVDMSEGLAADTPVEVRQRWVAITDRLTARLVEIADEVAEARAWVRWSPQARAADGARVAALYTSTTQLVAAVTQITRTLDAAPIGVLLPGDLLIDVRRMLAAAGGVVGLGDSPGGRQVTDSGAQRRVQELQAARREVATSMRELEQTAPMVLSGALLAGVEQLAEAVEIDTLRPGAAATADPDEPADRIR